VNSGKTFMSRLGVLPSAAIIIIVNQENLFHLENGFQKGSELNKLIKLYIRPRYSKIIQIRLII
jgi:hypothetical protein